MKHTWNIHETHMKHTWNIQYIWYTHEDESHTWHTHGTHMEHTRNTHGTHTKHTWNIQYIWYTSYTCYKWFLSSCRRLWALPVTPTSGTFRASPAPRMVSALRYTMTSVHPSPPDPERHAPIKDVQRHSRQVLVNGLVTPILTFRSGVEMKDSSMLSSTNSTVLDLPPKFMRICSQRCRTTLQVSQNLANRKGTAIIFCNGRTAALRPSLVLNEFAGIPAFSQELRWFSR